MATNYTTLLGFALPTTGELSGTWGEVVNNNITELVEDAIAGSATANVTSANWTLTTTGSGEENQARSAILIPTGTPGTSRDIIAPGASKAYIVDNQSNGAVVVKASGTTGATVAAGTAALVVWDGSDFVLVAQDLANAQGTLAVANGGSGATSLTGVLKGNGTSAFTASDVDLASEVTGTLPVDNGGTGQTSYVNGELLIGNSTGNTLTKANLSAGSGVTITNGAGSIEISATGSGGTLTSVSGTGTVNGITLSGTVTTSGDLTLGGTLSDVDLTTQITGTLPIANGGTNATTAATARTNLGLGTAATTDATDYATAAQGDLADTALQPADVGTIASQNANNVSITGGSISGITDLAVADGGTGASTAAGARTNLGLGTIATQNANSVNIDGGAIDGTAIGANTASTGDFTDLEYTGTLTGGTGVINIGSGQIYKDASGNVGIGTSSPEAKLHVASAGGLGGGVLFGGTTTSDYNTNINVTDNGMELWARSNTRGITFSTGSTQTERARIDSSGNLLVGSTSGTARLLVTRDDDLGETSPHFQIGGSGYSGFHWLDGNGYYIGQNSNARFLRIYSGSDENTGVSLSPGTTSWGTFSDERLKYDIEPIANGLSKLANVRCVSYRLKDIDAQDSQKKLGVIAQDLVGVVDEVIDTSKRTGDDTEYMSVRYTELIPLLTKAIQELKAEVDSLKLQINAGA